VPGDGLAAYYAHGGAGGGGEPVFDASIGLTIEAMPPGVTLASLWSVL
jgi:Bardet-Biedl syndrome 5 protein